MRFGRALRMGIVALLALVVTGGAALAKEFVIGLQTDRSGPTSTVGPFVGDGVQDYIKLFNKKNLLPGHTIRAMEIDHSYDVPKSLESYERHKAAGAITISVYGTPHTVALTPKLTADRILGTSPGFGASAAANGERFPYVFPIAASYWSQTGASVKFIMDRWKDTSRKPKIAYLYYDNPAGREPLVILDDLQKQLGFELKTYAVPPPAVEMKPQVLEIARQYKADWVITHLFGKAPGVSLKEFTRVGFPRDRMVGFVWGAAESDLQVAGASNAEGYYCLQFAGVGENYDVIREIKQMYKDEGKDAPKSMAISVYYNRGVVIGALHARAIQLAVQRKGPNVTPDDVKTAMESVHDFTLGGIIPPLNLSAKDHEGGGWVQIYQVRGGKFAPATEWFRGFPEVIAKHVAAGQ
jgi:branched-chain amino acid transport system substrate-binding protein